MEDGVAEILLVRLERLEREFGELQYVIRDRLVASWIPDVTKQLREARADIDSLMAGAPRYRPRALRQPTVDELEQGIIPAKPERKYKIHNRYPKTYEEYLQIGKLQEAGVSINRTAKLLGVPYTTVYAYLHMSDDEVDTLRRKHEAIKKHGYTGLTRRRPPAQDGTAVQLADLDASCDG
jgi:DNA invertase Pin-like site-specific DNA recombinase